MRAFDTYVFPPVFVSIVMMKLCVAGKMKNVMASSRFCFKKVSCLCIRKEGIEDEMDYFKEGRRIGK